MATRVPEQKQATMHWGLWLSSPTGEKPIWKDTQVVEGDRLLSD